MYGKNSVGQVSALKDSGFQLESDHDSDLHLQISCINYHLIVTKIKSYGYFETSSFIFY